MPSIKTDNPPQQETFSQTPSGKLPSQGGDLRSVYGMTSVIANYSGFDWQSLIDGIKVGGSAKKASPATAVILNNVILTPLCEVPNAR